MPPLREVLPPEWRPWLLALGLALLLAAVLEAIVRGLLLRRDYDWRSAAIPFLSCSNHSERLRSLRA